MIFKYETSIADLEHHFIVLLLLFLYVDGFNLLKCYWGFLCGIHILLILSMSLERVNTSYHVYLKLAPFCPHSQIIILLDKQILVDGHFWFWILKILFHNFLTSWLITTYHGEVFFSLLVPVISLWLLLGFPSDHWCFAVSPWWAYA